MRATPQCLLLTLLGWGVLHATQAQVKPAPFAPACDLQELNRAYVASLNRLRHQLDPHSPIVVFDPALLVGAVLQAARMEAADSLFHATPLRSVELIGEKRYMQEPEVEKLVRFIRTQIQNSERHCAFESDPRYVYAAVAANKHFYVVKLFDKPTVADKDEQAACLKLGVRVPVVEVPSKHTHQLIYRAF
ncbi:hypothetical protein GCM10027422_17150 [Hymenobacter arcticus]